MPGPGRAGALGLALLVAAGCAARHSPALTDRLIQRAEGADTSAATFDVAPAGPKSVPEPAEPERAAVPVQPIQKTSALPSLETEDAALAAALSALAAGESVAGHRRVAAEYWRARVFDRAERHLSLAIALEPKNAALIAERARLWRDTGVIGYALSDAHRAVYLAPASADAQNTLGTVLYALGRIDEAIGRFTRAAALDPDAAWAHSNLCFAALSGGRLQAALTACDDALRIDPAYAPATRNRALVTAALERAGG